jgi:hypothetical protein
MAWLALPGRVLHHDPPPGPAFDLDGPGARQWQPVYPPADGEL